MSETSEPFNVIMPDGTDLTPRDVAEWAAHCAGQAAGTDGAALTQETEPAYRLSEALALMVEKLAEQRRNDLDRMMKRVEALETERATSISAARRYQVKWGWAYEQGYAAATFPEALAKAIEIAANIKPHSSPCSCPAIFGPNYDGPEDSSRGLTEDEIEQIEEAGL